MRVLVVENHRELAETVATGLRREGIAVDVAHDGQAALRHAAIYGYDMVVLDRDLSGPPVAPEAARGAEAGRDDVSRSALELTQAR